MDRRHRDRLRAHRLRLNGAVGAFALATLVTGCFDGRLDSFALAPARGGDSGSGGGQGGFAGAAGAALGGGGTGASAEGLLLDDFEDQDNETVTPGGWWYVTDDGTGPQAVMSFDAVTGRGVSRFGARLGAGPTTGFGSFLGLDLPGGLFDSSDFASLSFWARMEPAGDVSVRFQNPQGVQFAQLTALDADWREVRLPLSGFVSTEDGSPVDPTMLTHLQLWLPGEQPAFELYADDFWLLGEP